MAIHDVYEPGYVITGWLDNDGYRQASWFNRELSDDAIKQLVEIFPSMFLDDDVFFVPTPPIQVEIFPSLFLDDDIFFIPMAIRALTQPDQMLRNEVRRIR